MIWHQLKFWLWSIDQRYLAWRFKKQEPIPDYRHKGSDFTIAGRVSQSHFERQDSMVVHVIDNLELVPAGYHGPTKFLGMTVLDNDLTDFKNEIE